MNTKNVRARCITVSCTKLTVHPLGVIVLALLAPGCRNDLIVEGEGAAEWVQRSSAIEVLEIRRDDRALVRISNFVAIPHNLKSSRLLSYVLVDSDESRVSGCKKAENVCSEADLALSLDPLYQDGRQGYLCLTGANQSKELRDTSRVVVGVIDTGVSVKHEDVSGVLIAGRGEAESVDYEKEDGCEAFGCSFVKDVLVDEKGPSHGTKVVGVLAARKNDRGIVGTGWMTPMTVVLARISNQSTNVDIGDAIDYLASKGARIINVSFRQQDATKPDMWLEKKIRDHCDILFVFANGNVVSNSLGQQGIPNLVLVGAAPNSDYDISALKEPLVDTFAPGDDICTAYGGTDKYGSFSGTSFAAPQVSAAAAYIASVCTRAKGAKLGELVRKYAIDNDNNKWKNYTRFNGRLSFSKLDGQIECM